MLDRIANKFNNDFTKVTALKLNWFGSQMAKGAAFLADSPF